MLLAFLSTRSNTHESPRLNRLLLMNPATVTERSLASTDFTMPVQVFSEVLAVVVCGWLAGASYAAAVKTAVVRSDRPITAHLRNELVFIAYETSHRIPDCPNLRICNSASTC